MHIWNVMRDSSDIQPSYTIPSATDVISSKTHYIPNTTFLSNVTSATVNNSSNSSRGNIDMLFSWVFIACVLLAALLIVSILMVIVYWKVKRRRRTAPVTDARNGAGRERRRGRINLRNSIKRVFVSEGPLYAVSNLSGSRYTGLPERHNNNSGNPDSARSSPEPEILPSDGHKKNQHVIYQRYLSPIEGVPPPTKSVPTVAREESDLTYLQPIDELRASKRFLQGSNSPEPEDTYLEPLHGVPVPDEVYQKTSSSKPIPKPKPTIKRKP